MRMIEGPIPQDITKHKAKFIGNFSTREVVCLMGAAFAGLGAYFGLSGIESIDAKIFIGFVCSLPFLLLGFVKFYGEPFEKIAPVIFRENFLWPMWRKRDIHFPEFEAYEKSRPWLELEVEGVDSEEDDDDDEDPAKARAAAKKKKKNQKSQKKEVRPARPSKKYREIR